MTLIRIEGSTVINAVMKDGPAAAAGIKPKDVMLQIDGKNVADLDFLSIRQLLTSHVGRRVRISIRRGKIDKDVTVILADNRR